MKISEDAKIVMKRARTPEQRGQRRGEIINAAFELLQENEYEDVSLNTISRQAKLSKPSIYLYFKTREEIFLALFMDAFAIWMDEAANRLADMDEFTVDDIATAMVDSAWKNKELRMMGPLLVTSIEKNISDECMALVIRLKQEKCDALCREIKKCYPQMSEAQTFHLMLSTMSLFGQFVSYEKNDCLNRVLDKPEFAPLKEEWNIVVTDTVIKLLK